MTADVAQLHDARRLEAETAMLFSPVSLGAIPLRHRVVHAPTTRLRADPDHSPSAMMVDYYAQRASQGGLIITESAHPSFDSRGYEGAPGIYTPAQATGSAHRGAPWFIPFDCCVELPPTLNNGCSQT